MELPSDHFSSVIFTLKTSSQLVVSLTIFLLCNFSNCSITFAGMLFHHSLCQEPFKELISERMRTN